MATSGTLSFFCGKMAAGKATLARRLAARTGAILLLTRGLPVVMDFPGNTPAQRAWFRELLSRTGAPHELHFVDVPDALCKAQLRGRSRDLPGGAAWTSDGAFAAITRFIEPPVADEGFEVIRHERG